MNARPDVPWVPATRLALVMIAAAMGGSACIEGAVPIGGDRPDKVALAEVEAACDAHCDRRGAAGCAEPVDCDAACEAQFDRVAPCESPLADLVACASPRDDAADACEIRSAVDDACLDAEGALFSCLGDPAIRGDDTRLRVECDDEGRCTCSVDLEPVGSCDMLIDTRALTIPAVGCCAPLFVDHLGR